jgi:hypothetical protein
MISTVSILGVDDSVSPEDLVDISQKYPFVEWGINLRPDSPPRPGYPSDEWLEDLVNQADRVRLRGVLHGRWKRDILRGVLSVRAEKPLLWSALRRIQIDVQKGYEKLIEALQLISNKEVILNTEDLSGITKMGSNAHPLLPKKLMFSYPEYCGYSLLDSDADLVTTASSNSSFWISVDGFRGPEGITMDLLKVERFLDLIEDHVTEDNWFKALMQTPSIQRRFSDHPARNV